MLSTDREEFDRQLGVLFGGWPQSMLTPERREAYWRGLEHMKLGVFVRCVNDALGQGGPAKLPTVNDLWQTSNKLRHSAPTYTQSKQEPIFRPVLAHANKCMLSWLLTRREQISDSQLAGMVQVKNRITGQYEDVYAEDKTLTGTEIRDALFKAFDAVTSQQKVAA